MSKAQSADKSALLERKAEIEKLIDEAPCWGAYVGALGEELRGISRSIELMENAQ